MKKFIAIILAGLMVFSLAACGGGSSATTAATTAAGGEEVTTEAAGGDETAAEETTEAETEDPYADADKEVVVGIIADPGTFYPWPGFSQGGRNVWPMIYQTLLSDVRDPETGVITHYHALMKDYEEISPTEYEIHLYENIMDTAGNHFTANDVAFCWDQFKTNSPAASNISGLLDWEVVDDYTIKAYTTDTLGIGDFEEILTTVNMVTQAAFEASPDEMATDPVGTTGYVLESYTPGSNCIVTLNDTEYWNQAANDSKDVDAGYIPTSDTNHVKTVDFEFITDQNTMAIALESGEIDINTSVSTTDISIYRDDDNYSVHQYPDNILSLVFNCSDKSPFQDVNLRKALAYNISAQDLLDACYDGDGWILNSFAMDYQIGYQDSWAGRDYFEKDSTAAKGYFEDYLKSSGTSAADLHVNLIYTSQIPAMEKYAQVVQAALIELTGNANCCELTSYDSSTYTTMTASADNFDLYIDNTMSNKTYVLYNWHLAFDGYDRTTGDDKMFSGDTKLWDLVEDAMSDLSEEHCTALQDYVDENVYYVSYICGAAYWAGSSLVDKWVLGAKNSVAICAMDFDWSQKY